jgi:ADP-ribose pyrophosphatase YjhB (NUDIX family)
MQLNHNPRTRVGGFVLRHCEGVLEVLLMQRFKPERGLYYVIPGGSLEADESIEQGAIRELLEETNLEFVLGAKLYESCNPQSQRMAHYFVAYHQSGEPCLQPNAPENAVERLAKHYNPIWVRLEQVASLPLFPSIIRHRLAKDLGQEVLQVVQLIEED